MKTNLENFGFVLKIGEDFIELPASEQTLNSDIEKIIRSYNDHRITMAMTLMAYQVPILVDEPDTVRKSFPGYWQLLEELFGIITEKVAK
jgi:3-phosphoshikimate 1-carboxyvinyltransferase